MVRSIGAELLLLRKRAAVWVLLGVWTFMAALFGYILPYVTYLNGSGDQTRALSDLAPSALVSTVMGGYPFFGGVIALVLAAMVFGSEYGWGTWKTVFTQGPGRARILGAKLAALGVALVVFVLVPLVVDLLFSIGISVREGLSLSMPDAWLVVRGLGAGWLILAVWATLGALLAIVTKGTAMAIGLGVLYGLVVEGLVSAFVNQVDSLSPLTQAFLRTNGYSLLEPLGLSTEQVTQNGPGAFAGPYVGGVQAMAVLVGYLVVMAVVATTLLRRRDVA